MRTSFSALETYKQCPQKYKFHEIDKIRQKKSKEAVFGTHIHATLKYMFVSDPLFPTLDQVLEYYRAHFPSREQGVFKTDEEHRIFFDDGTRMLKQFYGKNAPWNYSVLDLESRFEIPLTDAERNETHVLAGTIDRIDKLPNGTYEIIDYKTAKRMPAQSAVDENLQLSLYALGIQKKWPHIKPEQLKVSLYFLKHGEKLSSTRSVDALARVESSAVATIAEIRDTLEKNELFEPIVSPLCDYCSYKPICPMWRHLYRKKDLSPAEDIQPILTEYLELKKNEKKNKKRLSELQAEMKLFMEQQDVMRIFGEEGAVTRSVQKRHVYLFEKIREILEPLGEWEKILAADEKKLKALMKKLPPAVQEQVEKLGIQEREFSLLKATFKKIQDPEANSSTD
ncbi:MAG: hypothetical protein A3I44_01260 [Candidatus Sungbacteria bacterium RIFCSPLOWO2_02_FULL_51_17]|uniref:PD-(D/E)XK endonuclease-like domain-containing protein n=1 Tax=Candidatus Sungbacteria bacterium RIFCSPHIGHO2_02_FULL_51_29 TaxID=1802273 RepID=A0A1G2KUB0_9BACT|nr:MAG: hypothetical protein A2676_00965 [Candidatus Sungbacteria bacterium RIFCSPHIGHO2_01_FULL_51_22]OHA02202.1 MAG: hypothetical protein A3C16_00760 [Candidatus Sungbacteria bacterium RIFCSPHIGHO2_02_FULL_51_29]OHA07639.1 MAG: hypothetical protein A3B29_05575 [Candidatus Sungbacteria bacterium RIFCSPLOWO2_01_FULL_51_34]OHA10748.1 MAG: hypothetical protein A3I44_01260 [Candidatus Sungbacteria bacterium RIFCSPLOWO2_02_FULL_51_17]